jgi:katanin p80 WD40 repeat-containing subunit B1
LWDLRTKDNTTTLKHHTKQVTSMDVSPDAKMLLSGSEDGTVKIWDLRYPEKLIFTYVDHSGPVNMVKFHPEDITFASGSSDKTAKYYRCEPKFYTLLSSTQVGTTPITAIEFSDDGRILYTAANDSLKLWNMGKHGLLLDSVESPWKGVQDLCMINGALTGIAWGASGLSVWVYYSKPTKDNR